MDLPNNDIDHNNNNNNHNNHLLIPEHHRIQDFEEWLRQNALRSHHDDNDNAAEHGNADTREARARFQEYRQYQESLHAKYFPQSSSSLNNATGATSERDQLLLLLQQRSNHENTIFIHFIAADKNIVKAPLVVMAKQCDAIYALARHEYGIININSNEDCYNMQLHHHEPLQQLTMSLESFSAPAVQEFVSLVVASDSGGGGSSSSSRSSSGGENHDDRRMDANEWKQPDHDSAIASCQYIVECCQMAHYLQNATLLESITAVLMDSIDSSNCLSICQLADQLQLHALFEKSLSCLMDTIGQQQQIQDNEVVWEAFTPELQERIITIQKAIQCSVHKSSRLYFSSLQEYISIFAERVQYYKERLADAQEQAALLEVGSYNWEYVQDKIEKQTIRVKTLEVALAEQKRLFCLRGQI